jgi:DNA-binding transcriptional regulator GbsR (MarR family)
MDEDINQRKQQFIEDTGLYFEGLGLTRMAGRIVGWLLICDPPHQSMPEIVEALQAAKSSISTALWQLQQVYLIERFSLPGQRRDYYRLAEDVWQQAFQARMHGLTEIRKLAEKGLALMSDQDKVKRRRLELMRDMYGFMEREFPKLLEEWEAEKRARGY